VPVATPAAPPRATRRARATPQIDSAGRTLENKVILGARVRRKLESAAAAFYPGSGATRGPD